MLETTLENETISNLIAKLVQAFEDKNAVYLLVADTLVLSRSTARRIMARFIRGGQIHELSRGE